MPANREDRIYAQADGRAAPLADAWRRGWQDHRDAGPAAINPYDGSSPTEG